MTRVPPGAISCTCRRRGRIQVASTSRPHVSLRTSGAASSIGSCRRDRQRDHDCRGRPRAPRPSRRTTMRVSLAATIACRIRCTSASDSGGSLATGSPSFNQSRSSFMVFPPPFHPYRRRQLTSSFRQVPAHRDRGHAQRPRDDVDRQSLELVHHQHRPPPRIQRRERAPDDRSRHEGGFRIGRLAPASAPIDRAARESPSAATGRDRD